MKKTILHVLLLCCFCFGAKAQFNKGDVLLGGNLSVGTSNQSPNVNINYIKGTNIYINPTIGFFTSPKSLYSFGIIYGHSSYDYGSNSTSIQKSTSNSYGLNFSKQCFMPIAKNFYFIMGGGLTGMYVDNKNTYYQNNVYQTDKGGQFSLALQPGISYKLTKKLLVDIYIPNVVAVNYATGTQHYFGATGSDTKSTSNSFNVSTNLNSNLLNNLTFGFRFLLGKKG